MFFITDFREAAMENYSFIKLYKSPENAFLHHFCSSSCLKLIFGLLIKLPLVVPSKWFVVETGWNTSLGGHCHWKLWQCIEMLFRIVCFSTYLLISVSSKRSQRWTRFTCCLFIGLRGYIFSQTLEKDFGQYGTSQRWMCSRYLTVEFILHSVPPAP